MLDRIQSENLAGASRNGFSVGVLPSSSLATTDHQCLQKELNAARPFCRCADADEKTF